MSDVTSHYIVRAKSVAMAQYESLISALGKTIQRSGWVVHQRSFIVGVRSLNEEDLTASENLEYFKAPSTSVELIRTKLAMTIFDEHTNVHRTGTVTVVFPQTNATVTCDHTMGQSYPLIRPGPGVNPTIYPPFLTPARRGLPEDRIPKDHLFFSFGLRHSR